MTLFADQTVPTACVKTVELAPARVKSKYTVVLSVVLENEVILITRLTYEFPIGRYL